MQVEMFPGKARARGAAKSSPEADQGGDRDAERHEDV